MRTLLMIVAFCCSGFVLVAQTSLMGKITDAESSEPLISATVLLTKNGVNIGGTVTDFDGNYSFSPIDPGTYNIEFSYTGYQSQRQEGVVIFAGRSNKLDIQLSSGVLIDADIEVIGYRIPLVEQDNTTQGQTITGEQIRNLPTRNINALAATTAGLASADEGGAISVRGSRSDATDYYVDGVRVTGSLVPESEIDQLQVITGGVEARYGDVTGGIISITTKGPASKWSGGVEAETSEIFDAYDNRLVGFNVSGPILKKATGESILGIRLSGRYTYRLDDSPSAVDVYRVNDETLKELEDNPIILKTSENGVTSPFVAAEFTNLADVDAQKARPFEDFTRYDLNAKLDARVSDAIDISFTGAYSNRENMFTPGNWRVFNSHNNPIDENQTLRGNFRFRHRLSGDNNADNAEESALIQNASYTLQFGYENNQNQNADARHGDNYFDYGYVGNFDFEWVPTFNFDPTTQTLNHIDYRQVLRGYAAGEANPTLANYNNALDIPENEGLNNGVGNSIIFFFGQPNAVSDIGRDDFYAVNGRISDQYDDAWGFHTNVGWVYNLARFRDNDLYNFTANSSFDLVPDGNSEKGRHSIEFGVWYEQRINRSYSVNPRNLWDVARQQANSHIQGIAEDADSIGLFSVQGFPDAVIRELTITESPDNKFFKSVRDVTGQSLTDYVNVDGLTPDQLALSMFSARELNDENILSYYGYDYLGNEFDGTFEEFFTAVDDNGIRTFPVAPNRPILAAAYIQDKFTFRDIIFRIGLRVERYDANTKVLKDNYSLYEIQGASDFHTQNPDLERPGSIGDDFKVYINDGGSAVQGYRDEDQWYFANGTPANSPNLIFPGGLVFPAYADDRVNSVANFIKSRDFDTDVSFQDYEPQLNWMPRLAFSFPISEEANFFAHYDILTSRPPSNTIATAYDYFYFTDNASSIRNNPNLQPQTTISYEVGFQQQLSKSSALKLSAYYKEMRDMIQRRTFFPVPIVNQYTTYDNIDFGTVKGFSFAYDLRRTGNVSLQANYTLQFADGTGSGADSQRGLTSRGNIRNLIPLDFDERHRFVAIVDYRYGSGSRYNGPRLGGLDILSNFGVNLQATTVSGRPYTATVQPVELGGTGFKGALNGARKPWTFTLNVRVDKTFKLSKGGRSINAYVRVSNLLDRENILNIYSASGSAYDDGYLASSRGLNQIATIEGSTREVSSYLAAYQWTILNPGFFSLPRRIFAGVIYDF